MPQQIDVLIIGAGPTGLTLACELVRRGLSIRIIDTLAVPTTQSRALALQARSLEVFEKLGILDKILDQGLPSETVHLYESGKQIGMTSLTSLPIAYPFVLIIPQAETEAILNARLNELGTRVERGTTLLKLEGNAATLSHETVTAQWIIGCDGAHSTVRHALNIPFKGTKFAEDFFLADVTLSNFPYPHRDIHGFSSSQGVLGIIPLPKKKQFRLITSMKGPIPDLETLLKERTTLSLSIESILWSSTFTIHRRIVPAMSQGSVFLCGDAAHIHSPAGGQGLNIGIQDSFNLAWKLALIHHGHALPELLKTYHEERHPVAQHTLWGTTLATFFISIPYPHLRHFFFRIMTRLFKSKWFRKRFAAGLAEVRTNYRHSRLSWQPLTDLFWGGPRPGERAPILENPEETRFTLLIFGAPDFKPEISSQIFTAQYISLESTLALPYCAKKPCFYLIRPDGYIACRSRSFDKKIFQKMKSILFFAKLSA